jgi:hypothetical protein
LISPLSFLESRLKTVTDGSSDNFSETISIVTARNKETARK